MTWVATCSPISYFEYVPLFVTMLYGFVWCLLVVFVIMRLLSADALLMGLLLDAWRDHTKHYVSKDINENDI